MTGPELVKAALPKRAENTHKGHYGRLCVLAGSTGLTGAARFAAMAAVRAGAGLVTLACPNAVYDIIASSCLEAMSLPLKSDTNGCISVHSVKKILELASRSNAVLAGCGLGKGKGVTKAIHSLVTQTSVPLVLDADGINALEGHINLQGSRLILTPHDGELLRLVGADFIKAGEKRSEAALRLAKSFGAVLVMKGPGSVVASPDGRLYINNTGNPGMAKGGSGDVLAGVIAAILVQGADEFTAASAGVYLHGLAGDLARDEYGEVGMTPLDILTALPKVIKSVRGC